MHQNYDHTQERLSNVVGDIAKTGIIVSTELAMKPRRKPVEVRIRTAADDVVDARRELKKGKSSEDISQSLQQSSVAQRIAKDGGNVEQYTQLIVQNAEMENAVSRMPSAAHQQVKRKKKSL